jgi:hypothetical protein
MNQNSQARTTDGLDSFNIDELVVNGDTFLNGNVSLGDSATDVIYFNGVAGTDLDMDGNSIITNNLTANGITTGGITGSTGHFNSITTGGITGSTGHFQSITTGGITGSTGHFQSITTGGITGSTGHFDSLTTNGLTGIDGIITNLTTENLLANDAEFTGEVIVDGILIDQSVMSKWDELNADIFLYPDAYTATYIKTNLSLIVSGSYLNLFKQNNVTQVTFADNGQSPSVNRASVNIDLRNQTQPYNQLRLFATSSITPTDIFIYGSNDINRFNDTLPWRADNSTFIAHLVGITPSANEQIINFTNTTAYSFYSMTFSKPFNPSNTNIAVTRTNMYCGTAQQVKLYPKRLTAWVGVKTNNPTVELEVNGDIRGDGDFDLTGDMTINGSLNVLNINQLNIGDAIGVLNANNIADITDSGMVSKYNTTQYAGMIRKAGGNFELNQNITTLGANTNGTPANLQLLNLTATQDINSRDVNFTRRVVGPTGAFTTVAASNGFYGGTGSFSTIYTNGSLGVGRTGPNRRFEVSPIINANNQDNGLRISTTGLVGTSAYRYVDTSLKSNVLGVFRYAIDVQNNDSTTKIPDVFNISLASGDIGINNIAPTEKLDVVGSIKASEYVIGATGAFTNLAASQYVIGATGVFTNLAASQYVIGATGAFQGVNVANNLIVGATGKFQNLRVEDNITYSKALVGPTGEFQNIKMTQYTIGQTGVFTNLAASEYVIGATGVFQGLNVANNIIGNNLTVSNDITLSKTLPQLNIGSSTTDINKLEIRGNTNQDKLIRFRSGGLPQGQAGIQFSATDNHSFFNYAPNNFLIWGYAVGNPTNQGQLGTEVMRLTSDGNLIVGATGRFQNLRVEDNITYSKALVGPTGEFQNIKMTQYTIGQTGVFTNLAASQYVIGATGAFQGVNVANNLIVGATGRFQNLRVEDNITYSKALVGPTGDFQNVKVSQYTIGATGIFDNLVATNFNFTIVSGQTGNYDTLECNTLKVNNNQQIAGKLGVGPTGAVYNLDVDNTVDISRNTDTLNANGVLRFTKYHPTATPINTDRIGRIGFHSFRGANNTTPYECAAITVQANETWSSATPNAGSFISFANTKIGTASLVEAMRIAGDDNKVGINMIPGFQLDITSNTNNATFNGIRLFRETDTTSAAGAAGMDFYKRRSNGNPTISGEVLQNNTYRSYRSAGSTDLIASFRTQVVADENWSATAAGTRFIWDTIANGTTTLNEKMRLTSGGSLLIGQATNALSNKLVVNGTTRSIGQIQGPGGFSGATGSFSTINASGLIAAPAGITGSTGSFQNLEANNFNFNNVISGPTGTFTTLRATNILCGTGFTGTLTRAGLEVVGTDQFGVARFRNPSSNACGVELVANNQSCYIDFSPDNNATDFKGRIIVDTANNFKIESVNDITLQTDTAARLNITGQAVKYTYPHILQELSTATLDANNTTNADSTVGGKIATWTNTSNYTITDGSSPKYLDLNRSTGLITLQGDRIFEFEVYAYIYILNRFVTAQVAFGEIRLYASSSPTSGFTQVSGSSPLIQFGFSDLLNTPIDGARGMTSGRFYFKTSWVNTTNTYLFITFQGDPNLQLNRVRLHARYLGDD